MGKSWICALAALGVVGCSSKPDRVPVPQLSAADVAQAILNTADRDGDFKLSGTELDTVPGIKEALLFYDTDRDGKVTKEELTQRVEKWYEAKVAVMSVQCQIKHRGKPLAGATVTFTPEPFLATVLKPATGTTDSSGLVTPIQSVDLPGVQPGLYRVEVRHNTLRIDTKYQSESVLGLEVAGDSLNGKKVVFNLLEP